MSMVTYYFYFIIEHVLLYSFKKFGFKKNLYVQFYNITDNVAKNGIFPFKCIQIEPMMTQKYNAL